MTVDLTAALGDARRLWRRDRELLLRIAGVFVFLPAFASLLLLPDPVAAPGAGNDERQAAFLAWGTANAHWIALRLTFDLFGVAALLTFYLDRHRTLGEALQRTLTIFPRYVAAALLTWAMVVGGLFALVLPGFYAIGRLTMTGPAIVAERRGVVASLSRSTALTQGMGWAMFGIVAATTATGYVITAVLVAIDDAMALAHVANPVTVAIIDAAAAGVSMLTTLARVLIVVAVYRRLGARRGI